MLTGPVLLPLSPSSYSIYEVLLLGSQLPGNAREWQKPHSTSGMSAVSFPRYLRQNPKATMSLCHKFYLFKKTSALCEIEQPLQGCEKWFMLSGMVVTV